MSYAAENKKPVSGNFMFVAILLMFAYLCMRSCQSTAVQNSVLKATVATKTDSIQAVQKKADSAVLQAKQSADIATSTANANEALKDKNDSLQQQAQISEPKQEKTEVKPNLDAQYLKTDVLLLAAQKDSLQELVRNLSKEADSLHRKIAEIVGKDTAKGKQPPVFFPSYVIGGKSNMPVPSLRVTGQLGLLHNFTTDATYFQILARQYFGHASTNEFLNVPLLNSVRKKPTFSASITIDIVTYEKKFKAKKRTKK